MSSDHIVTRVKDSNGEPLGVCGEAAQSAPTAVSVGSGTCMACLEKMGVEMAKLMSDRNRTI